MTAAEVLALEAAHGSTLFEPSLVFERGSGALLYDHLGHEYIDCAAGIGVASLGHGHQGLTAAIARQAAALMVCPPSYGNGVRAEFVSRLSELAGEPLTRVFLSNSGTEANEAAIKWARVATGRRKLIAAKRGFAGRSHGSLALTWNAAYRRPFEPLDGDVSFVSFDDVDELAAAVDDDTAAVVLEVVQGEAGVHPASGEFLTQARRLTAQHGALLVLDEVQSGVGRTGNFLAAHAYDVKADIVTLAKGLAGGVPIGATLMSDAVAMAMPKGGHGSTFGGNPLACAAGLVVLDELTSGGLLEHSQVLGERLRRGLEAIGSDRVRAVRGVGLMIGVELRARAAPVIAGLRRRGVLTVGAGSTVVRFLPPLVITAEQVDEVIDRVALELAA
ncbi:MAG TPA: aminotransferase class III-fold pyridoxal phosphate-dependent enzyme [Trueperaceae bacterium]|nr:aminotransferase class III-fold pyridoxal phosphate-dependent enzyme [Trueperaceae bacterium]